MGKKQNYHPFFSKYLEKGDQKIILKKAGIHVSQLVSWKKNLNTPNCKSIKWFLLALAEYKDLDFDKLLLEFFETI